MRLCERDFGGCHSPGNASDPGGWAVGLCGRHFGMIWLAGLAVVVGVASGSSNERAQRCCHLPRGSQDRVYKVRADRGSSLDAAPVTGSLLFYAPVCCLAVYCGVGFSSWVLFGGIDCIWLVDVDYFSGGLV